MRWDVTQLLYEYVLLRSGRDFRASTRDANIPRMVAFQRSRRDIFHWQTHRSVARNFRTLSPTLPRRHGKKLKNNEWVSKWVGGGARFLTCMIRITRIIPGIIDTALLLYQVYTYHTYNIISYLVDIAFLPDSWYLGMYVPLWAVI